MSSTKRMILVAGLLSLIGVWTLYAQQEKQDRDKEERKARTAMMKRKLELAQKVLEGVTMNNPELVEKSAEGLIKISQEAEWKAIQSDKYMLLSDEFRREAKELIRTAQGKNEEAASLAYVKMSLVCFSCHRHVRETKLAFK